MTNVNVTIRFYMRSPLKLDFMEKEIVKFPVDFYFIFFQVAGH